MKLVMVSIGILVYTYRMAIDGQGLSSMSDGAQNGWNQPLQLRSLEVAPVENADKPMDKIWNP